MVEGTLRVYDRLGAYDSAQVRGRSETPFSG
jgi:hypothetical protein